MKKRVYTLLMIIALLVFIGSGYYLANYYLETKLAESDIDKLIQIKLQDENKEATDPSASALKGYQTLHKMNPDMIGWVKIPNSSIDYPVMQTKKDEEYYIHRDFDKNETSSGLPFLSAVCDITKDNQNLMVYGHHMKSGIMFAGLLNYKDKSYFDAHKIIELDSVTQRGKYEIFAAFYSKVYNKNDKVFKFYQHPGKLSKKEFMEYVKQVKVLSEYNTGIDPSYKEQLLTLVTCSYHTENGRFVVVAHKVD